MDTLVKNGTVVTAAGISKADIAVEGGRIALIGADLEAAGARVIDAHDCYVIPGGVDVHTHLDTPAFAVTADDFESGTRAAACGGTTTIVDFCQQGPARASPTRYGSGTGRRAAGRRSTTASTSSSAT
jgi:dihydropyrimidinase